MDPLSVTDEELDQLADRAKRAARVQPATRTDLGHFSPDVAAFFVEALPIVDALVQEIRRLRAALDVIAAGKLGAAQAIAVARKACAGKPAP